MAAARDALLSVLLLSSVAGSVAYQANGCLAPSGQVQWRASDVRSPTRAAETVLTRKKEKKSRPGALPCLPFLPRRHCHTQKAAAPSPRPHAPVTARCSSVWRVG